MALIPPDAGIRMRMQLEENLMQPLAPVQKVSADLADLQKGQTFSARIQEALPENTYKALVAGRQLTLQLPEGAKAGDLLDLVVIDRSAKVVIAKQVEANATAAPADASAPYPFAKFSQAARMISQLLPTEGEAAPPALLNRGQPLLAQAPQAQNAAAQLAPVLAKAVAQSGMFYEAHQAQWVAGKLPLAQILQEPQGQLSSPAAFMHAARNPQAEAVKILLQATGPQDAAEPAGNPGQRSMTTGSAPPIVGAGGTAAGSGASGTVPMTGAGGALPAPAMEAAARGPQAASFMQQLPDTLRPLVQQQLDAAAMQRVVWHGEVWPRQQMDWEIEWQNEREGMGGEDAALRWQTSLSLTTPRLGRVDASLQLTATGVQVTLATPYGASAADLRDESPKLAKALAAAGVPMLTFHVRHEDEPGAA